MGYVCVHLLTVFTQVIHLPPACKGLEVCDCDTSNSVIRDTQLKWPGGKHTQTHILSIAFCHLLSSSYCPYKLLHLKGKFLFYFIFPPETLTYIGLYGIMRCQMYLEKEHDIHVNMTYKTNMNI